MLNTEKRNPKTQHIDKMSTLEMVYAMNEENMNSVLAVERASASIAQAIDVISEALAAGGHLVYIGAGTSGRLGILDASECPPSFGVEPEIVRGIIAGGNESMFRASEGAEDGHDAGATDVADVLHDGDVLVGISAAGNAEYVVGAMEMANVMGCTTIALTSNADSAITKVADIVICCDTGPEVITGSTRLKAGNSQKFVLNMLSTCAMIKTGKVYENLMINVKPSNKKLRGRVIRITCDILGCDEEKAIKLLDAHNWSIRDVVDASK